MVEKLFHKYDFSEIKITDPTLGNYICIAPVTIPHSHGRQAFKQFGKAKVNLVERLVNKLLRGGTGEKTSGRVIRTGGRLQGKKMKAMKIVEQALDAIAARSKKNPVQVLVDAVQNTAPREDTTRVQHGGVSYQVSVDVSAQRRLDMALRNITLAAIMQSFDKKTTLAEALANEILLASNADVNSYAVKKRDETERIARSAR